jgi:hypothetical protein
MLAGQGGHVLIDIRPHHREAFSTMGKMQYAIDAP